MTNPHLCDMSSDFLYHLDINIPNTKDTSEIQKKFGDVKFVCMGGTKSRMEVLAKYLRSLLEVDVDQPLVDISEAMHRYAMFKVGPVLCCSHGIGMPSISILVHELIKLVRYALCKDPIFIRLGTCGGLGVPPGTIVVTKQAYNGYLRSEYDLAILGERVSRPGSFDASVYEEIAKCQESGDKFTINLANTMSADCFYEGQARLDGSVCAYTLEDKMKFLNKLNSMGIKNIEMEALELAALTRQAGIKAGTICVTLLNRLNGDQITMTKEQKEDYEQRPLTVVGRYIIRVLLAECARQN